MPAARSRRCRTCARSEDGDSVKAAQRRIAELRRDAAEPAHARARVELTRRAPVTEKDKPDPTRTGADLLESSKAIARADRRNQHPHRGPEQAPEEDLHHAEHPGSGLRDVLQGDAEAGRGNRHAEFPAGRRPQAVRRAGAVYPDLPGRHHLPEGRRRARREELGQPGARQGGAGHRAPRRAVRPLPAEHAVVRQGRPVGDHHPLQIHPRGKAGKRT